VNLYNKCCGLLVVLLALGTALNAQVTGSIHTGQTTLVLQAGREEPRLVSLQSGKFPAWPNGISERLIGSVEEGGRTVSLHWKLDERDSHITERVATFVYQSAPPRLRLTWKWEARAEYGPVEHSITIENLSSSEIWLPLQDSFCFRFPVEASHPLQHWYIEKGAGKPSEVGTHQVPVPAGYRWSGRSSTYARDQDEREIIPWFMVERDNPTLDGWYVGIEFSGRTRLTLQRDAAFIDGAAGLDPDPGPFRTRLLPNETFATPTVFVGGFGGGADGAGNILRPWVRSVLNNPATWKNSAYPPLVNNSWGSGMQIDEALALRMVRDSAELGLELFHIDAGWFRGVGDWYPSPSKFPHGFAPIVSEAHRRGLKFGIWVDWAQAGIDNNPGALSVRDPKVRDWLVADVPPGWQPADFVGRTIDLGFPPASNYARQEVERIITQYHLDMMEHDGYVVAKNCSRTDHPHAPATPPQMSTVAGNGIAMADNANSTDVSYHAVRAYYDMYSQVRREHPELLLEICNDGGRMVDFGSASHGDYFSITDSYDPVSNRRAFYDASHVLPTAMLEDYVEKWPTPKIENFRYMLRSGMMGMLTIMQDTNRWTAEEHAAAKAEFALYKQKLRPLIRDAELYHVSERPDGIHWDGMEYFDSNRGRGVLYTFRGSTSDEKQHRFPVEGVQSSHSYRLHFSDHSAPDRTISGRELLDRGLTVALPLPLSSELVFIDDLEVLDKRHMNGEPG
jgi:alpha-galactosidase